MLPQYVYGYLSILILGQGHLTVTFTDFPTEAQLGTFTCEVNALDDVGHSVTFVTSHQVKVTEPSMADVIQHMQELTLQNQQLEADNRNQTSLIADLQSGLVEAQHIESGSLECGDSSKGWTNTTSTPSRLGYTYHDVSHTFARAYSAAPPHLQYGVVDVYYYDVHTAMSYVIYYVDVVSVTQPCPTSSTTWTWSVSASRASTSGVVSRTRASSTWGG